MKSGDSGPLGERVIWAPDGSPAPAEMQDDLPGPWGALVLPVILGVAAWAVDRFTRSGLGDWRYVPTVVLALGAVYFGILGAVVGLVTHVQRSPDGESAPRWRGRAANVLVSGLVVAAFVVSVVLAIRDHSVVDAVTALVIAIRAALVPWALKFPRERRSLRWASTAATLLMPAWVLLLLFTRSR